MHHNDLNNIKCDQNINHVFIITLRVNQKFAKNNVFD